ncbi:hypothetical protein THOM_0798 [Trachipleistophora hominis]|uniref:Uncharacterized protein n=1 Tax=Trachipleistophora hominis TaxID=72359 RepID=L7JZS4_TRAHO|nr:hypothetical protein THOM_0798 [Trachipleistophora hominis]
MAGRRRNILITITIAFLVAITVAVCIFLTIRYTTKKAKVPEKIQCVLKGNGVDCFIISVLQALYNLKNYKLFLDEIVSSGNNNIESILKSIHKDMEARTDSSMDISAYRNRLLALIRSNSSNTGITLSVNEQNDADEFLTGALKTITNKYIVKKYFCFRNKGLSQAGVYYYDDNYDIAAIPFDKDINDQQANVNYVLQDKNNTHIPMICFGIGAVHAPKIYPNKSIQIFGKRFILRSGVYYTGSGGSGHYFAICKIGNVYRRITFGCCNEISLSNINARANMRLAFYEPA